MQPAERSFSDRLTRMETQMARIIADIESEKGTRARTNEDIYDKLEKIRDVQDRTNRIIYMMVGGLMVIQIVLTFAKR